MKKSYKPDDIVTEMHVASGDNIIEELINSLTWYTTMDVFQVNHINNIQYLIYNICIEPYNTIL